MTMYADKALRCVTCGTEFVFSAAEQEFHATKGLTHEPRRCRPCRQARRSGPRDDARAPAGGATATAARGAVDGSRPSFHAVCSACGGEALLPFEPVGNRPVLCSACYDKIRAG
jgi:CxxC-x17-CxxC domain-containing protein